MACVLLPAMQLAMEFHHRMVRSVVGYAGDVSRMQPMLWAPVYFSYMLPHSSVHAFVTSPTSSMLESLLIVDPISPPPLKGVLPVLATRWSTEAHRHRAVGPPGVCREHPWGHHWRPTQEGAGWDGGPPSNQKKAGEKWSVKSGSL